MDKQDGSPVTIFLSNIIKFEPSPFGESNNRKSIKKDLVEKVKGKQIFTKKKKKSN